MKKEYELARKYHLEGNNCVESIVKTCNDSLSLHLPEAAIRMVSGMGGGLGRSGCVCGALSGACLILGALAGRVDPSEKPLPEVYQYTGEFHDRFKKHFGATCCRCLNRLQFGTPEYRKYCINITATAADMLSDFIAEKGLDAQGHRKER
ncbi:C-GCAxxG-C-C family (seleno)protein [uncultured Megasphaera sp.]|uniref:C-GCAxxG-C-C family (seleno)protein n=1 Tax=uncultured Megasphaera sp. TaxID=165188 RepID=UPI002595584F|nr:C-GCAxxG-C-C family (seleno)protein [uncultured Megasphaera sp.]